MISSTLEILTTILTSALVSSIITFLLRMSFENKQQHRFEKEIARLQHEYAIHLERLKAEVVVGTGIQREIIERRLNSYPQLVELVYRTRNMSRELVSVNRSPAFVEELAARTRELENSLYRFRIDLERDGTFGLIHTYKNLLKAFNMILKDIVFCQSKNCEPEEIHGEIEKLRATYDNIEALHKTIIGKLSASTDTPNHIFPPQAGSEELR